MLRRAAGHIAHAIAASINSRHNEAAAVLLTRGVEPKFSGGRMTNQSITRPRARVARAAKTGLSRLIATLLIGLSFVLAALAPASSAPQGEMTWGVHTSLAPTW